MESLIFYIASALLGGLLSWLIFGDSRKIKAIQFSANRDKAALNDLVLELNTLKTDTTAQVQTRDAEIALLKKKLGKASAGLSDLDLLELNKWKAKANKLESELNSVRTQSRNGSAQDIEQLENEKQNLKQELTSVTQSLKQKNVTISLLKAQIKEQPQIAEADLDLHDQITQLKAELKAAKKKSAKRKAKQKDQQFVEKLDLNKLAQLIESGALTRKVKKTSKKKKTSKVKPEKEQD